ncbi:MAG: phosphoglycerate mutase family protein [Anaerolineales bacterium]|nr:phosphoglycerate mutase family protein [Anaerolineales bacterium]NUQ84174.1 histidine phosphatase family protein [Anaerolineales bacterium]
MNAGDPLILIRHSLPEIVENIPAHAWELSDEGRSRVVRLAEKIKKYQLEVIGSSVEPKARETAEILCKSLGVDIVVMDGLHEHERSSVQLVSKEDFQSSVRTLFEKPDELIFGNETAAEALERFKTSVELLMELYAGKRMAIVAHGTVISLFASELTGLDGYQLWNELGLPSFVVLDLNNRTLLETVNFS